MQIENCGRSADVFNDVGAQAKFAMLAPLGHMP
jgi:hypothetical protein